MALTFHEDLKTMSFDITGYSKEDYDRRNDLLGDWLNVRIAYRNGRDTVLVDESLIVTSELESLALSMEEVAAGEESGFIFTSFKDSLLEIAVTRVDDCIAVQISVSDPDPEADDEDRKYICQGLNLEDFREINDQFQKWHAEYLYAAY